MCPWTNVPWTNVATPLAPLAAPVISTFMSSLIRPMATAIMNMRSSSDGQKQRIINKFIPAVIRTTKMAGTQTANNIKRALDSKPYSSALTSLSQNARAVDDRHYLPSKIGDNVLETMKSQARSFDKILKIRLSELSTASSSYLAAIIKEFRL